MNIVSRAAVVLGVLGLVALAAALPSAAQEAGTACARGTRRVVMTVAGLRSDSGRVLGGLYAGPEGWLDEDAAVADCSGRIRDGRARCTFENVGRGAVAIAVMHDEDGDGSLGRDLFGLPSEGYGFSNDVREPLGPPSFDAASFATASLVVHIHYGI